MSGFANNTLLRDGIRVRVGVRKQRKITTISLMAIRHHALLLQYIITTNCIVFGGRVGGSTENQASIFVHMKTEMRTTKLILQPI